MRTPSNIKTPGWFRLVAMYCEAGGHEWRHYQRAGNRDLRVCLWCLRPEIRMRVTMNREEYFWAIPSSSQIRECYTQCVSWPGVCAMAVEWGFPHPDESMDFLNWAEGYPWSHYERADARLPTAPAP